MLEFEAHVISLVWRFKVYFVRLTRRDSRFWLPFTLMTKRECGFSVPSPQSPSFDSRFWLPFTHSKQKVYCWLIPFWAISPLELGSFLPLTVFIGVMIALIAYAHFLSNVEPWARCQHITLIWFRLHSLIYSTMHIFTSIHPTALIKNQLIIFLLWGNFR